MAESNTVCLEEDHQSDEEWKPEEIELEDGIFEVTGPMETFGTIQEKLQELNITPDEARLERIPTTYKGVTDEQYADVEKLIDILESDDDVNTVYHNMEEA